MRPRKRTDWPIVVYRYWVEPEFDTWERLPEAIKQEAEAMRALWNQLIDAFAQRQSAYSTALAAQDTSVSPHEGQTAQSRARTNRKPSSLAVREIQQAFLLKTQQVSKESPVTWANKQFVTT